MLDEHSLDDCLTCRECGYQGYFFTASGGYKPYSCKECGEIQTPKSVPFHFRNPDCPSCGRQFTKEDRIPTTREQLAIEKTLCPRCKNGRLDLTYSTASISFSGGKLVDVPEVGQILHAQVRASHPELVFPDFPEPPSLRVPGMECGCWIIIKDSPKHIPDGSHRFRVLSIRLKGGDLSSEEFVGVYVAYVGPISEDEMWNNDAPL